MTAYALATLLLVFILGTCLFGLVKGGAAERLSAAIILANHLVGMINQAYGPNSIVTLANNGVTALVLLGVAVRFASPWLGGVMLLFGLQFTLHAAYIVLQRERDMLYVALSNINIFAISLCLLAGVLSAMRGRRAAAVA
ncbi:hypothetical protein [Phenylobacterium sp.]|jgi:hypothetical protein|uniref:hypothetical protein n=1 Tax=Phenylobacterium sp. TaxID=1871053 RepID=UPI002F9250DA